MKPGLAPPSLDDLARHLTLGVSLMLATRDGGMKPEVVRCRGARLGADGLLRTLVPLPEGARTLQNVGSNGNVALSAVLPTTYRTLQVTGRDARLVDWPGHEAIVAAHVEAFGLEVEAVGLTREVAARMFSGRVAAVAFTPEALFDQTPGPLAGLPVAP